MKNILFIKDTLSFSDNLAFVARLPIVKDEEELFIQLSKVLNFPEYFGFNWNAVNECLQDFHWIREKGIVLIHKEIPILEKSSLSIYLEILFNSVQRWLDNEEHYFIIVFPEQSRCIVEKYFP